jgi:hypothetical protein
VRSGSAQPLIGRGADGLRCERAADGGHDALQDNPGDPSGQLLKYDRSDECAEVPVGAARPVANRPDGRNEAAENRIAGLQVFDRGGQ